MVDPRERFSAGADDYARYRPDYADEVVKACAAYVPLAPGANVVDVGCGTGISTRLFARHGYRVIGIEPNDAMRTHAQHGGGDYRKGEAASTGLARASADLIFAAQALHWFDMPPVLTEWKRVLRPGGACAAFWNYRSDEGWQAEYEAMLRRHSKEYPVVQKATGKGDDNSGWVKSSSLCQDIREVHLENAQSLDWDGLQGRLWSSSYMIHGSVDREAVNRELRAIFDKHSQSGRIAFAYKLYLLLWRIA
jgi:SAM-dependent methyltransferase